MPITILDGILIVVMLISAILAMIRGFSREVFSIASWGVAGVAALYFYKSLSPTVANLIPSVGRECKRPATRENCVAGAAR